MPNDDPETVANVQVPSEIAIVKPDDRLGFEIWRADLHQAEDAVARFYRVDVVKQAIADAVAAERVRIANAMNVALNAHFEETERSLAGDGANNPRDGKAPTAG